MEQHETSSSRPQGEVCGVLWWKINLNSLHTLQCILAGEMCAVMQVYKILKSLILLDMEKRGIKSLLLNVYIR